MNKKVYVSILGSTAVDGDCDNTELVTEGEYVQRNGKYLLKYNEQIDSELGECSTIIKMDNNMVVMTRTGQANTQMIFEQGKRHVSHYETPLGSFTIGVSTDSLEVNVDETGGNVRVNYVLDINSSAQIHNKLHINIRPERI